MTLISEHSVNKKRPKEMFTEKQKSLHVNPEITVLGTEDGHSLVSVVDRRKPGVYGHIVTPSVTGSHCPCLL